MLRSDAKNTIRVFVFFNKILLILSDFESSPVFDFTSNGNKFHYLSSKNSYGMRASDQFMIHLYLATFQRFDNSFFFDHPKI